MLETALVLFALFLSFGQAWFLLSVIHAAAIAPTASSRNAAALYIITELLATADKMADLERKVLEFYQLPNPYPNEWPAEKDEADALGEGLAPGAMENRRLSRYEALASAVNERRSMMPGPDSGASNVVQKDEADPLGATESVVRSLKQMGLPVQDDSRLRMSNIHIHRNHVE